MAAGVLYLYGNYGGDIMNFDMAAEMVDMDDIKVAPCSSTTMSPRRRPEAHRRRGVAGIFFAYKMAGAKADRGDPGRGEADRRKALDDIRTMGVALSPCTVPAAGRPTFTIGDDEMEIGMGIHGEPGVRREELRAPTRSPNA